MRLLLHFARFGPYHLARLRAVADELSPLGWEVIGLQTASSDATYDWRESVAASEGQGDGEMVVTVFPGRVYDEIPFWECRRGLGAYLDRLAPDAVAVPGWGTPDARITLAWCRRNRARAVIMSETREVDGERRWWKEHIKALMMRHVHGALVGGEAHREYLAKLGIPPSRIETGYNVVDNAYFATESAKWRASGGGRMAESGGGESLFFLASNRFIERKNLMRLIEAYAQFLQLQNAHGPPPTAHRPRPAEAHPTVPWSLCLLGDGPLRADLINRCHELGLEVIESAPWEIPANRQPAIATGTVYFPGFRQIEELPRFYAAAAALIHPALEEPWGLVINEAMACGLPILSGNNVGAAAELVREGGNGWTFDAGDTRAMVEAMARLVSLTEPERKALGQASVAYLEERCPTHAFGRGFRSLLS